MRIVLLATRMGPFGGVQRYSRRVAEALTDQGHDIEVFESADWPDRASRIRGIGRFAHALGRADLAWVLHPRLAPAGTAVATVRRIPTVVSTYGFETWGSYPRAWRFALEQATVVTAISVFSAALLGAPGRDAAMLRPTWGIDPWSPEPFPRCERDAVLLVSRLDETYKGIDLVLELAPRFAGDDLRFVIAGAGDAAALAVAGTPGYENVKVVRSPDDALLAELYRRAAVVLLPSRAVRGPHGTWTGGEGFGIVLLEAARAGAPVIASDEGSCPETVGLIGNGLVRPVGLESFATALELLLDDDRLWSCFQRSGLDRAVAFSPAAFGRSVSNIVDRATSDGP